MPFDTELEAVVESLGGMLAPTVTPDSISWMRQALASERVPVDDVLAAAGIERENVAIDGDTVVSVLRRRDHIGPGPGSTSSTVAA